MRCFALLVLTPPRAGAAPGPQHVLQIHGTVTAVEAGGSLTVAVDRIRVFPQGREVCFEAARAKAVEAGAEARRVSESGGPLDPDAVTVGAEVEALGPDDGVGAPLRAIVIAIRRRPTPTWLDLRLWASRPGVTAAPPAEHPPDQATVPPLSHTRPAAGPPATASISPSAPVARPVVEGAFPYGAPLARPGDVEDPSEPAIDSEGPLVSPPGLDGAAAAVPPEPPSLPQALPGPAGVTAYLEALAASPAMGPDLRLRLECLGITQQCRPIPLVVVSAAAGTEGARWRLLAVAAQHGDEPAGTWALLQILDGLARGKEPALRGLLDRVTLYLVPVANPDALAAGRRQAANGRNMNRDWAGLHLPETQAVEAAIRRYRPHVLLDLHEQTPCDTAGTYVQAAPGSRVSALVAAIRRTLNGTALRVPVRVGGNTRSQALLHWSFAARYGRTSFLVESRWSGSVLHNLDGRAALHRAAVTGAARALAGR